MGNIKNTLVNIAKDRVTNIITRPITELVDTNLSDIVTSIGLFAIRAIRGKFTRSIGFQVGVSYGDWWLEEALYGIIYKYNDVKKMSNLRFNNHGIGSNDADSFYSHLAPGTHNLKYRKWNILLAIVDESNPSQSGRILPRTSYTIITYDLDPTFVTMFEQDMVAHRNSLLKIHSNSPNLHVYNDYHESDGFTYWEKSSMIPKRRINTVYIPIEQKKQIVDTINGFFANKKYYIDHGVSHNLKILLYGPPGSGKDSIAKMIASEWNRNLYYITGGKEGKFIPQALTDNSSDVHDALLLISDVDKYPFLIREPEINMDDKQSKDENVKYKQLFGNMINALDGVMSPQDRIVIMTTNHIEEFSETLLRPGRIDLKMEIGYVTPEVFRRYVHDFYHVLLPADIELDDNQLTIAKMQGDVLFNKLSADEFISKYLKKAMLKK